MYIPYFCHLELLPQLEVEDLQCGSLVVPGTHLVQVGGEAGVCHAEDLVGQSTDKGNGVIHSLIARNGDGGRLIHRLPVMNLRDGV